MTITTAQRRTGRSPTFTSGEGGPLDHRFIGALSDGDFAKFQQLINREAGIWLAPVKKALVVGRLGRRLRDLGMATWSEYYGLVVANEAERFRMLDAISTNETHFFREARTWEFLVNQLFPAWKVEAEAGLRPRRIRAWSSACSTGEEPYTIAMTLLASFPRSWSLEIFASDLSTKVLERAQRAVWSVEKADEIPPTYLKAFMLRGEGQQAGLMRAGPEIRSLCTFTRLNLAEDAYPAIGQFDMVFCRNVLIYFDRETKERVIARLIDRIGPGGYLLLGHSETLNGFSARARAVLPTVYQVAPGDQPLRPRGSP